MTRGRRAALLVLAPAAILALIGVSLFLRASHRAPQASGPQPLATVRKPVETHRVGRHAWVVSTRDRDAYLSNFTKVMKQIVLQPNPGKEGDSVADLSILVIAEESPMYAAGFRKDDRILRVNGTPIRTMGRAANLVHEIKACERLSVQVRRADQVIEYQFDFQ